MREKVREIAERHVIKYILTTFILTLSASLAIIVLFHETKHPMIVVLLLLATILIPVILAYVFDKKFKAELRKKELFHEEAQTST